MKSLIVSDVMNPSVITVSEEAPLREALDLMLKHRISSLVVVGHAGHMVGIISETDLLRAWQEGSDYTAVMTSPVQQYMTTEVISCAPHKSLDYAMQTLARHNLRRLVVVAPHHGGRFVTDRMMPIGILSQTDIVRALSSSLQVTEEEPAVAADSGEAP